MNPIWTVLFILAPLPVLITVGRIRLLLRRRNRPAEPPPAKLFDPPAEPSPNALLRRFTSIERVYLRQQFSTARNGFYIVSWLVFAVMTASLFPDSVSRYPIPQSHAMAVWFSFLHASILLAPFSTVIAVVTAMTAGIGMTGKLAQTTFYRTRPLSYRMLFWGRILPALFVLLLGYVTGLVASLLALVAFYGPVWNHLYVSGLPMLLKLWQVHELVWLLRSPVPMFVSIATSMVLVFSIGMVLLLQPFRLRRLPKPLTFVFGLLGFEAYSILGSHRMFPALTSLGLTPSGSSAPAPLPMYLVPLVISAVLLCIAQISTTRAEN